MSRARAGTLAGIVALVAIALVLVLQRSPERSRLTNAAGERPRELPFAPRDPALESQIQSAPEPAARDRVEPTLARVFEPSPVSTVGEAHSIRGRVVDDLGQPVAGASVQAWDLRSSRIDPLPDHPPLSAASDADGRFELAPAKAGRWWLSASAKPNRRSETLVVRVPTSESATLVLPGGARVGGVVVDAAGDPIAGAAVLLVTSGEEDSLPDAPEPAARTDALGRFRIDSVMPGMMQIAASSAEHARSPWTEVALDSGDAVDDLRIVLVSGGRIEGSLHPSLGDVARRSIQLYSFSGSSDWRSTHTDAEGRFVLEGVVPQRYVIELQRTVVSGTSLQSRVTTTESAIRKNIEVASGATTHVVLGAPVRAVRALGRVTCAGRPLAAARVSAYGREGQEDRGEEASTDADGRFELGLPGPGTYSFHVSLGRDSTRFFERDVPDQDVVELSFEVPSSSITGRVLAEDGRPLGRVPVTLTREGPRVRETFYRDAYHSTYTDGDGRFSFLLLAEGTYTLRAPDGHQFDVPPPRVPHGRALLEGLVVDGGSSRDEIELRLPAEGRISGVVVGADGLGVADAALQVLDARGVSLSGDWETTTDATGHFDVAHVAPGTHSVRAKTRDGRDATSAAIQVEAGRTASARIELR